MLIPILLVAAVVLLALVLFIATRPSDFRVSRSVTMAAPPEAVFAQINDFHRWDAWSPWAKLDPDAQTAFHGAESGEGAIFGWSGNKQIGEGGMTITESRPHELIRIKLAFLRPFKATSTAEFTFRPAGEGTEVTWTMFGNNNFMAKAVGLFMDCDAMVGKQFEQGLASIRAIVETPV